MIRRAAVVVVLGVVLGLGCSDGVDAVFEAEELAAAALLTEGDLPPGNWVVVELDTEQLQDAAPGPGAESPDECGTRSESALYEQALTVRARNLIAGGPQGGDAMTADRRGVGMIVGVFESEEALSQAIDVEGAVVAWRWLSEECQETLGERAAALGFETRIEEPRYGLRDARGVRSTTVVSTRTGTSEMTIETHYLVRGRVLGIYSAINGDSGGVDHQGLLEAFEARVMAAQE